ncbi:MAG: TIGR03936 family radical SAM-associated protein [Anaerolineaceae bacterium]|jgi:radical SAM-linked protein
MLRVRIHYSKTEPLRFTGNLDMQKIWERTLRRAHLPVVYSQGFHPQPKLNLACPLPLGITSQAEVIDVWLDCSSLTDTFWPALQTALPPGIEVRSFESIDLNAPALQTQTLAATYTADLRFEVSTHDLSQRVTRFLSAAQLLRQRRGKIYDLRPLVEDLHIETGRLVMRLAARDGATGRPEEVLDQLGIQPHQARLERVMLHFMQ